MSESTCRPRIWCPYVEKKICRVAVVLRQDGQGLNLIYSTLGTFSVYFILYTHVLCINIKDWDIKYFYFHLLFLIHCLLRKSY